MSKIDSKCECLQCHKGCKSLSLSALACLSKMLKTLGMERYLAERCNFTGEPEEHYEIRLDTADKIQIDIYTAAFQALSCPDISSAVCKEFGDYVSNVAVQFYEMFLLRAYDPLFPVHSDQEGGISLLTMYQYILDTVRGLFQTKLEELGSTCQLVFDLSG